MPSLAEIRQQYPQYNQIPDAQFADAIYQKFYAGKIDRPTFDAKIGVAAAPVHRGNILPVDRDAQGNLSLNWNSGIPGVLRKAASTVEDAYQGRIPMWDEAGNTSPQAVGRAFETAATINPVNPAIRAGGKVLPGVSQNLRRAKVTPPTAEQLKEAGEVGFKGLKKLRVDYLPKAVANRMEEARIRLEDEGFAPNDQPSVFAVLDDLSTPGPATHAPLEGLVRARRRLGKIAVANYGKPEAAAALALQRELEGFIKEADPRTVMAGPASSAGKLLDEANANYAAGKRSDKLHGIEDDAVLTTAGRNSGLNLDNTLRQKLEVLLKSANGKDRAGFTKAEIDLIRKVHDGKMKVSGLRLLSPNAHRRISNLLGGGGGLGAIVTGGISGAAGAGVAGAMGAGPLGAGIGAAAGVIAPAIGLASRMAANRATQKGFNMADEMVRSRAPLAERMMAQAPYEGAYGLQEALAQKALIEALLAQGKKVY